LSQMCYIYLSEGCCHLLRVVLYLGAAWLAWGLKEEGEGGGLRL